MKKLELVWHIIVIQLAHPLSLVPKPKKEMGLGMRLLIHYKN